MATRGLPFNPGRSQSYNSFTFLTILNQRVNKSAGYLAYALIFLHYKTSSFNAKYNINRPYRVFDAQLFSRMNL